MGSIRSISTTYTAAPVKSGNTSMLPTFKPRKFPGGINLPQVVLHTDTRSIFGDNHAATEDALMLAHATNVHVGGLICEEMRRKLSQPWHVGGQLRIKYTRDYLAMRPNYDGVNIDVMPSYEVALKHQRQRDAAMEKLTKDYEEGRVDEDGKKIGGRWGLSPSVSLISSEEGDGDHSDDDRTLSDMLDEHTHDNSEVSSGNSMHQSEPPRKRTRISQRGKEKLSQKTNTVMDNTPKMATHSDNLHSEPTSICSTPSTASSRASHRFIRPKAKPKHPSTSHPPPILPLPKHPTYASHSYFELAALCRARSLPGYGNESVMRNRVIQDDINVATGRSRELKVRRGRKAYKTNMPEMENGEGGDAAGNAEIISEKEEKKGKRKRCIREAGGDDGRKKAKS